MTHPISLRPGAHCAAWAAVVLMSACGGSSGPSAGGSESTTRQGTSTTAGTTGGTTQAGTPTTGQAAPAPTASLVPLATPVSYTVTAGELLRNPRFDSELYAWNWALTEVVPSELRSGGKALRVTSNIVQSLPSGSVLTGRSYTLTATARQLQSDGSASVMVRFLRPGHSAAYRTYSTQVTRTDHRTYAVDFTVPAYAHQAEVAVVANGNTVIVDSLSLQMRAPLVLTQAVRSLEGSHVPAGYALAFNDEFNGNALDRRKWFTRYLAGDDFLNDEKQRYRDNDNHRVSGGVLSLVARKVSETSTAPYESGMIRSDWTTRYGYFEARVKMPGGKGVWPAFWLNSDVSEAGRQAWPPEIDIFEFVNNGQDDKVNMLHTGVISQTGIKPPYLYADPAVNTTWGFWWAPFNFDEGWHTIGSEWTPTSVTTYVDGRKIATRAYQWTYADGAQAGPAHILLNLAIGGAWAGRYGIDDAAFPQALQIDWVRAYKKVD